MSKRKKIDDKLYPESKYKDVLYTPRHMKAGKERLPGERQLKKAENTTAWRRNKPPKGVPPAADREEPRMPVTDKLKAFFSDRFVRNTVAVCAAVALVSAIAIPTVFARPTMDIVLNDGGRVMHAPTAAKTVQQFLDDNKVVLGPDDTLDIDPSTPITESLEIIIRRAMPVMVNTEDASITVTMVAGTVQDALDRAGVVPAPQDEVYPSPDTFVRTGMYVEHIAVDVERTTETREIPYETSEESDSSLAKGDQETARYGENGELTIITERVYKNGIVTYEEVVSEEVTKEPVTEIIKVGTYVAPPPEKKKVKISDMKKSNSGSGSNSSSGGSGSNSPAPSGGTTPDGLPVQSQVTLQVTAYCSNCDSGSRTASGVYPTAGFTVAANPSQFSFGTKLFIPGFGTGRVEDTGGFGPGVIDVYMGQQSDESVCNAWGRKTLTVYVLE